MPWVDLYSKDDYASIYYVTSTLNHNVGGFDPEKPTLMLLHPMLLDSTWLSNQFGDPRLHLKYNLVAFDMRSSGQTTSHPTPKRDSWTDAADIALCHQILHLPPCHVLAFEAVSVNCALRFALLFPEMCLSLTLCNVPAPADLKYAYNGLDNSMRTWCWAENLEALEDAVTEAIAILFGASCHTDLKDDIAAYWQKHLPPCRRPWLIELASLLINGTALTPDMAAKVKQPILIVQGEMNEACPMKDAEMTRSLFTSSLNGAILYPVKGAGLYLSIVASSASIVNQVFVKFSSRLQPSRSDIVPPKIPIEQRMAEALQHQRELVSTKEPSENLDPMSPLSFSCLPKGKLEKQARLMEAAWKGRLEAFNPIAPTGRPWRKLSDSRHFHWFQGVNNGISISSSAKTDKRPARIESGDRASRLEREETGLTVSAKFTKPHLSASTLAEKHHIKTSMVKVVRETTTITTPITKAFL